jgi:predicted nucleic acid-binding protein
MTKRVLVDTNVLSLLIRYKLGRLKEKPEAIAEAEWYASQIEGKELIRSFATDAELRLWILSRENPVDRDRITRAIQHTFDTSGCIHSTEAVSESWAHLASHAKGKLSLNDPTSSQINDLWIAATARAFKLPLITHDSDFDWMGEHEVQTVRYSISD